MLAPMGALVLGTRREAAGWFLAFLGTLVGAGLLETTVNSPSNLPDAVQTFFFADHTQASKRAEHLERELALNYPNGPKRRARPAPTRRASVKDPVQRVARASTNPRPSSQAAAAGDVRAGMTADQVRAVLGRPADQSSFGRRARWVYQDRTVVFEGGRVTDVRR